MILSTKAEYAVQALLDLRQQYNLNGLVPVTLTSVAKRTRISLSYLDKLFKKLKEAGMVMAVRGPGGGYIPIMANIIYVSDVVLAVDDKVQSEHPRWLKQAHDRAMEHLSELSLDTVKNILYGTASQGGLVHDGQTS